ncbi:MAG: nucleotide triphosphate diphosphatase NUDT15 [Candidatus Nanosyncoccaceae bacterium]
MKKKKIIGAGVGVLILRNKQVLLGKRHIDPKKASSLLDGAGTWTMPGGKLNFGETFESAAVRKVAEEVGLKLKQLEVICVNNDRVKTAHFVTVGLFSDNFTGEPRVMEPDEITEWQWFDLNNLPSPMYFPSTKILENYKRGQFYITELSEY